MAENEVRITGGEFRGRKIKTPGGKTHPMGERERIALFNMLGDEVEDAYILDAYAGGGTLGFEALSRGADDVIFMEKTKHACDIIQQNAEILGLDDQGCPFCGRVSDFLPMTTDRFDIIFADPPYEQFKPWMVDELRSVLMWGGLMAVSHPGEPVEIDGLKILNSKKYAGAHITIYQREEYDRDDGMTDEQLYWLLHDDDY